MITPLCLNYVRIFETIALKQFFKSFLQVRTRGLPDDHVGQVRVVEIEGWR